MGEVSVPSFNAKGSLGLPKHPLGIFGFKNSGEACNEQKLYLEDGVLAVITVKFPPCPWPKSVSIEGRVDVWTTIPAQVKSSYKNDSATPKSYRNDKGRGHTEMLNLLVQYNPAV